MFLPCRTRVASSRKASGYRVDNLSSTSASIPFRRVLPSRPTLWSALLFVGLTRVIIPSSSRLLSSLGRTLHIFVPLLNVLTEVPDLDQFFDLVLQWLTLLGRMPTVLMVLELARSVNVVWTQSPSHHRDEFNT